METPISGYVSFKGNLTDGKAVEKTVPVPFNHTVVVSFKEYSQRMSHVSLYRSSENSVHGFHGKFEIQKHLVWERRCHRHSDVAHMFQTLKLTVVAEPKFFRKGTCFRLFFSFFPDRSRRVYTPRGWNCSVKHYTSFQHHLACNLKTECEDGRDETGDCPYSSPQCDGLVALCNNCYKLVHSLTGFVSNSTDLNKRADEYCALTQKQQGAPVCLSPWLAMFRNKTKLHSGWFKHLLVCLHTRDNSLPEMYNYAVVNNKRTVIHHFCSHNARRATRAKMCFHAFVGCGSDEIQLVELICVRKRDSYFNFGTVCELTCNKTATRYSDLKMVLLNNISVSLSSGQQYMTKCPDGHVTHTFLLCGSDQYQVCGQETTSACTVSSISSHIDTLDSSDYRVTSFATFICSDASTQISYTVVCDFLTDCPDESDESFCKHPPCSRTFTCNNGVCLLFEKLCDNVFHCRDESDETNCPDMRDISWSADKQTCPSPALVEFNGIAQFYSTPMKANDSCPDSHYRCPGYFNDCLPAYTRCNGPYDCIGHQEEEGCEEMKCPGYFRCRLSIICLHSDHVCDGWPHCPMNDDELACTATCSTACLCQGHTFLCPQPFSAALFPHLRYLDATGSGLTLHDVSNNTLLVSLILVNCSLTFLPKVTLVNVRFLDLSGNQLQYVNLTSVSCLENLYTLSLSNNPLSSLYTDLSLVDQHSTFTVLTLAHTTLTVLDTKVLSPFPRLQKLNLTFTAIHTISAMRFRFTPQLEELNMDGSPVQIFLPDLFKGLSNFRFISTENYRFCCKEILPHNFDTLVCLAPADEISSCRDLLQSWAYRAFLWLIAFLSLTGNVFCGCTRFCVKSMASSGGYSVFVTNLTMADFLMGVYITLIGVADERFRGQYLHNDHMWKNSTVCKAAGVLSLLSSEVSVLIIWFITLDRFVVLCFPFTSVRFGRTSASVACLLNWLLGWFLAVLPLLPMTSHWEFYGQTGICIPLPVTRKTFKGRLYIVSVLIIFNFVLFLSISIGQALIYWSVQGNSVKTNSTKVSQDMTIARRLITVAVTDFLCWFPVGLCGMLALGGIPIPGEVNVALAVFVLPLKSAVNPFIYTFNTFAEKRRKANEGKMLKWFESHSSVIVD